MRLNNITNPSAKLLAFCVMSLMGITSARAAQPEPWQLGFQPAATDMMARITSFNDFLLILMTAITVFVLGLMVYVMVRFNAKANPVPSKTSHNTMIEVVWTVIPILILLVIAVIVMFFIAN